MLQVLWHCSRCQPLGLSPWSACVELSTGLTKVFQAPCVPGLWQTAVPVSFADPVGFGLHLVRAPCRGVQLSLSWKLALACAGRRTGCVLATLGTALVWSKLWRARCMPAGRVGFVLCKPYLIEARQGHGFAFTCACESLLDPASPLLRARGRGCSSGEKRT